MSARSGFPEPCLPGFSEPAPVKLASEVQHYQMVDLATGTARLVTLATAARIEHEAEVLTQLEAVNGIAHLVKLVLLENGRKALVREFAAGVTAETVLKDQGLAWGLAVRVALAWMQTIGAVHQHGLLHGGIRPTCLLVSTPQPLVAGLAQAIPLGSAYRPSPQQRPWAPPEAASNSTPASPEQDVYALGRVLSALLAPFPESTPSALTEAVTGAVAPHPADRYRTMAQFSAALMTVLAGGTRRGRPTQDQVTVSTDPCSVIAKPAAVVLPAAPGFICPETVSLPPTSCQEPPQTPRLAVPIVSSTQRHRPFQQGAVEPELTANGVSLPVLEQRRLEHPVSVSVALLVVLVVAFAAWYWGRIPPPVDSGWSSTGTSTAPAVVTGADPVPQLEDGTVALNQDNNPVFTWHNPAPQLGDQYQWWHLGREDQALVVNRNQVIVPRDQFGSGVVCIEVQLVRADFQASQPALRICEEQP
ncbi:MAG: hypothetical protein LBO75_03020 [Bifidobacteriaceae bacterium]|nr:hypothetical protein [Bifidobacteriaceae bacterium]